MSPHRPLLRWFGGKWTAAPWIIAHFPAHRVYVEAYGGAASVLVRKPRAEVEVLNDIDDRLQAYYEVCRDQVLYSELAYQLESTLFSRREFELSCLPTDPADFRDRDSYLVETARRIIVRGSMAYGTGKEGAGRAGFRDYTKDSRTAPVRDWTEIPCIVDDFHDRLRGVLIEGSDALHVMRRHDGNHTLHYVDPPYVPGTRTAHRDTGYRHELDDQGHQELLDCLNGLRGMVILSGYQCDLYDDALRGWRRVEREYGATTGKRTECLWLNPAAAAALDAEAAQPTLFDFV